MTPTYVRISACLAFAATLAAPVQAQTPPLPAIPPNILASQNLPMVMMNASKDFTMFSRAYTDYDDIDGDGLVDLDFKPAYKYYGYFDSGKCYLYSTANNRFEPSRIADATVSPTTNARSGPYYCTANSAEWSGNFLNWATMSRIDVLRKVLFGGKRSTDTTTDTTLELSFVPRNTQAIVKYYNGSDLNRLTPFHSTTAMQKGVTLCRRPKEDSGTTGSSAFTPVIRAAVGNMILWNMTEVKTCNWASENNYAWQAPTITFLQNNYQTPDGSFASANPYHQHLTSVPDVGGDNGDYVARVLVCSSALLGDERCKNYAAATATAIYKPIGLLQEFGESPTSGVVPARAEFGLMMGSFDHNLNGGILRKALGQINDEIDTTTGRFVTPANGSGGIVASLSNLLLLGYDSGGGTFVDPRNGSTVYCFSDTIQDGNCVDWGNPVSEMILQSLRYYAGKLAPVTNGTFDNMLALPYVSAPAGVSTIDPIKSNPAIGASTRAQLYGQGVCRPLTMLTLTSGASSFDDDNLDTFQPDLGSPYTPAYLTQQLGNLEGITGTTRLIGNNGTIADNQCTGKTINDLGLAKGICADGPNFRGSYLGAGIAWYANVQKVRSDITPTPPDLKPTALHVRQYGVSMSGGVATISIPVTATTNVYITPASLDYSSGRGLPANLENFKILNRSSDGKSGAALVVWQHSALGEDQDMDQLQALRWVVTGSTLKVYSQAVEANTGSGAPFATGYTIVGTDQDGQHLHSGINNTDISSETGLDVSNARYSGTDQGPGRGQGCVLDTTTPYPRSLCVTIRQPDGSYRYYGGEVGKTYSISGASSALLREPLWYVAKYGGFKYDGVSATFYPTAADPSTWDVKRADGRPCGGVTGLSCSDGEPDNYFVARNPEVLEASLREIFETIVNSSNNAPAVASSQLNTGDMKYIASFTPSDGHGEINGYGLQGDGSFATTSSWSAQTQLTGTLPTNRIIITNASQAGRSFEWNPNGGNGLTTAQQNILIGTGTVTTGQRMLNWLRGDPTFDSALRTRAANSILGPIVNSNPTVQAPPNGKFFGSSFSGYSSFITTWAGRKSLLWVGAGDGMLHAFDANPNPAAGGSAPVMSYVPEPIFSLLPNWASPSQPTVQALVDGSPFTGDVKIGSNWYTYLFASLGRGAKAMYALNATDPSTMSEANAASIFKWQFTESDDPNAAGNAASGDLGYIVTEPTTSRFTSQSGQIAPMNNGQFAALFGNGISSTNGSAALYILFADGPSNGSWAPGGVKRFVKIVADIGPNNALSQPVWVDSDGNGTADAIYAGDLKGNLWKFDVSSSNTANWKVAYGGRPLFIATDATGNTLPITSAPEARPHPLGGLAIDISTGKAITTGDYPKSSTRIDAVFGIWDKPSFSTVADAALPSTLPRGLGSLAARTFNTIGTSRYISGSAVDWTTKLGWYLPFPSAAEMPIGNMAIAASQLAFVSIAPTVKANPSDADNCNVKPSALLNVLDPITGLATSLLGTVTTNGVTVGLGSVSVDDQKLRLSRDEVGRSPTGANFGDAACQNGTADCYRFVGQNTDVSAKGVAAARRIFWREIPGLKTFNAP